MAAAASSPAAAAADGPGIALPPGACDAHIHINDPRYAYLPQAELKPPPATVADYRAVQRRLGTQRVVVVQPSSYGTDNRCTLDAVAAFGQDTARAVVVVQADISLPALQEMHRQGARGIRLNLARGTALDVPAMQTLAARIHGLGWHLQLHAHADMLAALEPVLRALPATLVLDHLARIPPQAGLAHPAYAAVRRLIDGGRTWVKLSGAYLDSDSGPAAYGDRHAVAQALAASAPERMVWGSDWPHPAATSGRVPMPEAAGLLALLRQWVPDAALRARILGRNAEALYGFVPA